MPNSRKRVLIVDDDDVDLIRTRRALRGLEIDIFTESNPLHIVAATKASRPDLVLLDVNMPGLSGDHAARVLPMLAAASQTGKISIVLFSGLTHHELERLARDINADGFLNKDETPAAIAEFVQNILAQASKNNQKVA